MAVESAVFAALSGATTAGARVYPMRRPDGSAVPAITYQRIASTPINGLQGSLGVDKVRIQVDCWAAGDVNGYKAAKTLAAAARVALEASADLHALLLTEGDDYEPDANLYRVTMDFSVWAPR